MSDMATAIGHDNIETLNHCLAVLFFGRTKRIPPEYQRIGEDMSIKNNEGGSHSTKHKGNLHSADCVAKIIVSVEGPLVSTGRGRFPFLHCQWFCNSLHKWPSILIAQMAARFLVEVIVGPLLCVTTTST